jgi:hypothetical protein
VQGVAGNFTHRIYPHTKGSADLVLKNRRIAIRYGKKSTLGLTAL